MEDAVDDRFVDGLVSWDILQQLMEIWYGFDVEGEDIIFTGCHLLSSMYSSMYIYISIQGTNLGIQIREDLFSKDFCSSISAVDQQPNSAKQLQTAALWRSCVSNLNADPKHLIPLDCTWIHFESTWFTFVQLDYTWLHLSSLFTCCWSDTCIFKTHGIWLPKIFSLFLTFYHFSFFFTTFVFIIYVFKILSKLILANLDTKIGALIYIYICMCVYIYTHL